MKKRAVAYVRVSTKSDAQAHSFGYQYDYWQQKISSSIDLDFCGIYADKGVGGKWMDKRAQFMQMLEDARGKKFDIIYTKSVARFGRNTEEMLSVVRELRDLGVQVFFEKEMLDSFNPSAEIYLTIAAAVAENDLNIYSENQKWAIRDKFSKGYISIGSRILGYQMNQLTNTPEIVQSEAKTVRLIYKLYLSGLGFVAVASEMTRLGEKNVKGQVKWDRGSIRYILTNEKYKGCTLSQKTVTHLGECKPNKNMAKQFYMEGTHQPIIDADTFDKVQRTIYERAPKTLIGKKQPTYPFSSLISCSVCGKGYAHKVQNAKQDWRAEIWICQTANFLGKKGCDNTRIKDSVLKEKFIECYNEFVKSNYENDKAGELRTKLKGLLSQEQELSSMRVNRLIEQKDYTKEHEKIKDEIKTLQSELEEYSIRSLKRSDYKPITKFSEEKLNKFILKVTVNKNTVTFTFINGVNISRKYSNGPAGNQKGWLAKKGGQNEHK